MRLFIVSAATVVFLVLSVSASPVPADVYRCLLDGGHTSYQQVPCNAESKPMKIKVRRNGWSALRPGEQALLESYRKKDAMRLREPSDRLKKQATESKVCWKKRKQLDAVRATLRRGYKLKEGDELHRKRDLYEDYLRQYCS